MCVCVSSTSSSSASIRPVPLPPPHPLHKHHLRRPISTTLGHLGSSDNPGYGFICELLPPCRFSHNPPSTSWGHEHKPMMIKRYVSPCCLRSILRISSCMVSLATPHNQLIRRVSRKECCQRQVSDELVVMWRSLGSYPRWEN